MCAAPEEKSKEGARLFVEECVSFVAEIEAVGYQSADYDALAEKYDPAKLAYGYNAADGEEIYFIPNPALGLWIDRERFEA